MIKLIPEHVGGRVLLSDGFPALIASYENDKFFICWANSAAYFEQDDKGLFTEDTVVGGKAYLHVELLLDAPNPMDVEVPEWCHFITLWSRHGLVVLSRQYYEESEGRFNKSDNIYGWSPAPNQVLPKKG